MKHNANPNLNNKHVTSSVRSNSTWRALPSSARPTGAPVPAGLHLLCSTASCTWARYRDTAGISLEWEDRSLDVGLASGGLGPALAAGIWPVGSGLRPVTASIWTTVSGVRPAADNSVGPAMATGSGIGLAKAVDQTGSGHHISPQTCHPLYLCCAASSVGGISPLIQNSFIALVTCAAVIFCFSKAIL